MIESGDKSLIEWDNGRIILHDPKALEDDMTPKYFRHDRFASFQRQLNNFGFLKIAGKGRLQACV